MAFLKPRPIQNRDELIEKSKNVVRDYVDAPEPKPIKPMSRRQGVVAQPRIKTQDNRLNTLSPKPFKPEVVELPTQDLRNQGRTENRGREERV